MAKFQPDPSIFKQGFDGVYRADNGYTITTNTDPKFCLYDEKGTLLQEEWDIADLKIGNEPIEYYSYLSRTGRKENKKLNFKLSPAHFPKGTVFKVDYKNDTVPRKEEYTVDHISMNGTRIYLLSTTTYDDRAAFEGMRKVFNMDYVEEIVKRGNGKVVIRNPFEVNFKEVSESSKTIIKTLKEKEKNGLGKLPRIRKNEILVSNVDFLILTAEKGDQQFLRYNRGAFLKLGIAKAFIRLFVYDGSYYTVVKMDKFKTWIKSNGHRCFLTVKESVKIEKEFLQQLWGEE